MTSAIDTIKTAVPNGEIQVGQRVVIHWPGMQLLTLNELLRIDHRVLHRYRQACHTAVREAVWDIARTTNGIQFKQPVNIRLHRDGLKLVDTDGLYASFKFIIDGFRMAGVLRDDDPHHVVSISHLQKKGSPKIGIEIVSQLNHPLPP